MSRTMNPTHTSRSRTEPRLPLREAALGTAVIGLHLLAAGQLLSRKLLPVMSPPAPATSRRAHAQRIPLPTPTPTQPRGAQTVTFAHELRRRLAALRVLGEAIEVRNAADPSDSADDVDRLVHMLVQELHDLQQLESVMLDGAASHRATTSDTVDAVQIAAAAAQTVRLATGGDVRVQGPGRPIHLRTDPTMFRQAIENLIDNAVSCGQGKPVEVIVRTVRLRRPGGVEILVADRGPGPNRPPASRRPGNGLGLPLVRKFVHENNGRTWATDRPGGGAIYGLWLPTNHDQADQFQSARRGA